MGGSTGFHRAGTGPCAQHTARRRVARIRCTLVGALLATAFASPADAQADSAGRSWVARLSPQIVAGAFVRQVTLDIEDEQAASARGLLVQIGLRVTPLAPFCRTAQVGCAVLRRIWLIPQAGLGGSHLRGIDSAASEGSFATFEVLGAKLGYELAPRFSGYVAGSRGTRSSEQFEGGDVVNLWGTGASAGIGAEWRLTPLGRGVEVALMRHWGRFRNREGRDPLGRDKMVTTIDRPFEAWSIQVGWSGPFGGVTWPWQ